jgi:hypothetical protein
MEFVLFHEAPLKLFADYLEGRGIAFETAQNEHEGYFEITVPDDLDDELMEAIEEKYDELMNMNQELFYEENPAAADNFRAATILIDLASGEKTAAHVNPDLLGRILDVVSEAEFNELVAAIVAAVESPDARSYCQKVRAGDVSFGEGE